MIVKSNHEIREIIFRALSKTALKTYLQSEDKKLSDITESVDKFLNNKRIIYILTKEHKLNDTEIDLLTKNFVMCLCTCKAMQGATFDGIKTICSPSFWREVHGQCAGTSYEYSFSYTNEVPVVTIKDKGNNKVFQVAGFMYIGELMQSLIDNLGEVMLENPEENIGMDIWCYDALDFHHTSKQIQRQKIYINLSERLMLIEFVNRSVLDACRYKPDNEDKAKRFVNRHKPVSKPKSSSNPIIPVQEEIDEDGFVTV